MVTPEEIRKKALKKYDEYLKFKYSDGEKELFPLLIECDKKLGSNESLDVLDRLWNHSKAKKGYGYTVYLKKVKTKFYSEQDIPEKIYFDTEHDFLKYICKVDDASVFIHLMDATIPEFPELKDCMIKKHESVVKNADKWGDILKVCRFFRSNHKPGKFVRELPIGVHTKFVEENKGVLRPLLDVIVGEDVNENASDFFGRFNLKTGDPQISFRLLDKKLAQKHFSGFTYNRVFVCEFAKLHMPIKNVVIVENKHNMTQITDMFPDTENTIVIWGCGYGATVLKYVDWLHDVSLYYWGDIDAQGYEILADIRKYFPRITSLMMDERALKAHPIKGKGKESTVKKSVELCNTESDIYEHVKRHNLRFEQESLPESYVRACLEMVFSSPSN